jgi:hypothetical protein
VADSVVLVVDSVALVVDSVELVDAAAMLALVVEPRADAEVMLALVAEQPVVPDPHRTATSSAGFLACPPTKGYRIPIPLARITARVLKEPPSERRLRIAIPLRQPAVEVPPQALPQRTETIRITQAGKAPPRGPR